MKVKRMIKSDVDTFKVGDIIKVKLTDGVKVQANAEGKTRAKSLYDNYKMWCKGNGYYVCSMKKFNAELTAHPEWYADKAVTQGVLFYYGVALRQN